MEEERIEFVDVFEKTAPFGVDKAWLALLCVKIGAPVPALPGNFGNAMASLFEVLPEDVHIRSARITSSKANDCHILALGSRGIYTGRLIMMEPVLPLSSRE